MVEKSFINLAQKVTSPRKLRTSFAFVCTLALCMASIFLMSGSTPLSDRVCPMKVNLDCRNLHLFLLRVRLLACNLSKLIIIVCCVLKQIYRRLQCHLRYFDNLLNLGELVEVSFDTFQLHS